MSAAAAIGPVLGAVLLEAGSWRLLFLMNIPLVIAALVSLYFLRYQSEHRPTKVSLDWPGALAFAGVLALATVLLGALRGGMDILAIAGALTTFLIFLAFFVRRQFVSKMPIAEWRLFRIRSYAGSTGYVLLSNLVMYTTILAVPFFAEEVQGRSNLATGTLLGAVSIPVALLAPIGGRFSDELGRRPLVNAGSVLVLCGVAALAVGISRDVPYLFLAAVLAVMGIGLGLSAGPASAAAIESTPREVAGTAAGTNSMMRYVGSIIGAGVLGVILNTSEAAPGIDLFQLIFAVLVIMSVLAVAFGLLVHRHARHPGETPAEAPVSALVAASE
jgi:MFS family permease